MGTDDTKRSWHDYLAFRPWQRHSLVVMVGGLIYIALGLSYMTMGELSERRAKVLVIALNLFPMTIWGIIFVVVGSLAVLSSRWPKFSETWGYAGLTSLAAVWSGVYLLGYIFGDAPYTNVMYGLVFGLVGFLWWGISGLLNPETVSEVVMPNGSD